MAMFLSGRASRCEVRNLTSFEPQLADTYRWELNGTIKASSSKSPAWRHLLGERSHGGAKGQSLRPKEKGQQLNISSTTNEVHSALCQD